MFFNVSKYKRLLKKKEEGMEDKKVEIVTAVLWGVAMLLLLAAAFDVLPVEDNLLIFLAIACFIVTTMIKRISKGCCCK